MPSPRPKERKAHPGVERAEFEQRLAKAGLTKARFAELTGARREAPIRWCKSTAPAWVVPFLWLYANATPALRERINKWADSIPP